MSYLSIAKPRLDSFAQAGMVGTFVQELERRGDPPPLVPASEDPWQVPLSQRISSLSLPELCGGTIVDEDAGKAVKSGLLLWNDDLETSHTISQAIQTETGSYWHGIMHRREPDYGNSKYWFHKVGEHDTFEDLKSCAVQAARHFGLSDLETSFASSYEWNPISFIDLCEESADNDPESDLIQCLRLVQLEEIRLLLAWSLAKATGK